MTSGSLRAPAARFGQTPAEETLARLKELPASIRVLREALDACADPDSTATHLEDILSRDPGASAGLLKLANSAFFGVRGEVRTPTAAIGVVGFRRLQTLLRHLMAGRILESLGGPHAAVAVCRKRALAAAVIAADVGERMGRGDEAELRIAGLLHNVGELAAAVDDGDAYERLQSAADPAEAARSELGLSFEQIGAALMEDWGFPVAYVASGALWRTGPGPDEPEDIGDFVGVIRLAGEAALEWERSHGDHAFSEPLLELASKPPTALAREQMASIAAAVAAGLADLIHTL